ncbi:RCC1 domain-containing protein [Brevibacillus sp. SYSU BS000544]|uniref:RCC1 domain-containing protein n=1 Tax=Brevibacillus sp. SYSU BS000544 TaxID=3416443 RepID=UPI003CE5B62A
MKRFKHWMLSFALLASLLPVQVAQAADQKEPPQIDAGRDFSIARAADGTVWTWGMNDKGQIGDGTTTDRKDPEQVEKLKDMVDVSAGERHALALSKDGTVYSWGSNSNGQLGDGTAKDRTEPIKVKKLSKVIAVEAGGNHSMAIKEDGTLWAWGNNDRNQLGDGTVSNRSTPVQIKGIKDAKALALGPHHTLVLKKDGTVWAVGQNDGGQIGDGSYGHAMKFVNVKDLTDVVSIATGMSHALAVKKDGTVWAWGRNVDGQVGDGTPDSKNQPLQVEGLEKVVRVAAGNDSSYAIDEEGMVWSWGSNYMGTLGLGTDKIYTQTTPMQASDLSDVVQLDGGLLHAIVLKKDGTVWGMGKNAEGQLGNGGGKEAYSPIPVSELNIGEGNGNDPDNPPPSQRMTATGGEETVLVENAPPGRKVILFQWDYYSIVNHGMKEADDSGKVKFTKLPPGDGYYAALWSLGSPVGFTPIVKVTPEKNDALIEEGSLYTEARPNGTTTEIFISGKILDSSVKTVEISFAGVKAEATINGDQFVLRKSYVTDQLTDTCIVEAETSGKKKKQRLIFPVERDLVKDDTLMGKSLSLGSSIYVNGDIGRYGIGDVYLVGGSSKGKITNINKNDSRFELVIELKQGVKPEDVQLVFTSNPYGFEVMRLLPLERF